MFIYIIIKVLRIDFKETDLF